MDFYQFTQFVKQSQQIASSPSEKRFAKDLNLSSDVWQAVSNLFKFTSQFNYEHSISFFDCDGDIVSTPPVKGSKTQVITRHSVSFRYIYKVNNLFEKHISINGKLVKKVPIRHSKIPKQPQITELFNIHSHPMHMMGDDKRYSFFSGIDLNSLFSSRALCTGLITDELFIACKHDQSPPSLSAHQQRILDDANARYFTSRQVDLDALKDLKIIVYRGEFKKKLKRIS